MIRVCFFALLCCCATQALADIIPVQIGEREASTRLMIPLPDGAEWDVKTGDRRLRISVSGASGYRIPALENLPENSRISGVSGGLSPDELNIGLNCDCIANSYVVGDNFLTVDITPNSAPPPDLSLPDTFSSLMQPWHQPLAIPSTDSDDNPPEVSQIPDTTLDGEFSAGLAQAAYQGFVELREEEAPSPPAEISADVLQNIAIGVDAQLQTIMGNAADLPDPVTFSCSEVSAELNTAWADENSLNLQIGKARSNALSNNEDIDPNAMQDLALTFVGHGFGHEAKAVLQDFGDESDLSKAITYIADVIDGEVPPPQIGMETCEENLSFWGFLTDPIGIGPNVDPRRLMITYKLFPPMLQKRLETPFSDALVRAGFDNFLAELQDFRNTAMAFAHDNPDTPPPAIDLESAASARDILRADLTATDLDPAIETPRSPNALPLSLLETLRLERRDTPGELVLLDEVLTRHVAQGNYFAVLNLLADSTERLAPESVKELTQRHLSASVAAMTDPELVAFAYRESLPPIPADVAGMVRTRLEALGIAPPSAFAEAPLVDLGNESQIIEPSTSRTLTLPELVRSPTDAVPTFEQSETLLSGSAAMRNAIETFINDTDQ